MLIKSLRSAGVLGVLMAAVLAFAMPQPTLAQTARAERMSVPRDSDSQTIGGELRGDSRLSYVFAGQKGEQLEVTLTSAQRGILFVVTGPGNAGVLHIGATNGNLFEAKLPATGDYQIVVQARPGLLGANEAARFWLTMRKIDAKPTPPPRPSGWVVSGLPKGTTTYLGKEPVWYYGTTGEVRNGDPVRVIECKVPIDARWCKVERRNPRAVGWVEARYLSKSVGSGLPSGNGNAFDATGTLKCTLKSGQTAQDCPYGIIYGKRFGAARLWIATSDKDQRMIQFQDTVPVFSDGRAELNFDYKRKAMVITIGRQTFTVPEVLISR